jgi:hypothetical protein
MRQGTPNLATYQPKSPRGTRVPVLEAGPESRADLSSSLRHLKTKESPFMNELPLMMLAIAGFLCHSVVIMGSKLRTVR